MKICLAPAPTFIISGEPSKEHISNEGRSPTEDCQDYGQVQVENVMNNGKLWPFINRVDVNIRIEVANDTNSKEKNAESDKINICG